MSEAPILTYSILPSSIRRLMSASSITCVILSFNRTQPRGHPFSTNIFLPLVSSRSTILQARYLRASLLNLFEIDISYDGGWAILRLGQHQSPGIHNH